MDVFDFVEFNDEALGVGVLALGAHAAGYAAVESAVEVLHPVGVL
jgi:hypothetical protein